GLGYHQFSGDKTEGNLVALRLGLENTIKSLKASGKQIILVKDVPLFEFDVVKEVANNNIVFRHYVGDLLKANHDLNGFSGRFEPKLENVDAVIDSLSSSDIRIINPESELCNNSQCEYVKDNNALYYDRQHLNDYGAIEALKSIY
ncbi:TPA: hypothetical protein MAO48_004975, partial [Klebsiella pneumoniae]|nr:hypothetical protein [Klebsiella pneumoniae]